MQRHLKIVAAAALAVGGMGFVGSQWAAAQQDAGQSGQSVAGQPDAGAAGQAPAGQAPADASGAQQAGAAQGADRTQVEQAIAQTVSTATTKGGIKDLASQVSRNDQQRLQELSQQDTQQLDQTIEQIRQAFKDKYQQEFDLSRNQDQVFGQEFVQIGGQDAAEQARQAGARIGASDPSATAGQAPGAAGTGDPAAGGTGATAGGTSGTDTSGAGAAARTDSSGLDSAQTAGAAAGGQQISVKIEESHGMPAVQVPLVKEGSKFAIDIPDSTDAQMLTQNLQTELSKALQMKDQWPADANEAYRAISHHVLLAMAGPSTDATGQPGAQPGQPGQSDPAQPQSGQSGTGAGTSGAGQSGVGQAP